MTRPTKEKAEGCANTPRLMFQVLPPNFPTGEGQRGTSEGYSPHLH